MSQEAPEPIDILSTRDGYDRWAEIYDGEGNPLVAMEEPWVDKLLGDVRGLAVADIGCGTGRQPYASRRRERMCRHWISRKRCWTAPGPRRALRPSCFKLTILPSRYHSRTTHLTAWCAGWSSTTLPISVDCFER